MISDRVKRDIKSEWDQNSMAKAGAGILTMFVMFVIFAPVIATSDPASQDLSRALIPPFQTLEHPLGTDQLGRDMYSRAVYGARISVLVGILSISAAAMFGTMVGLVSGFYGGLVDDILMRITDIIITVPSIMVAVTTFGLIGPLRTTVPDPFVIVGAASADMPSSVVLPGTVIFALAFVSWTTFARIARSEAISVEREGYVTAARSIGGSNFHIIRSHILPNSIAPVLVLATLQVGFAIILESSLAFLGFSGADYSWGRDIATGRDYLASAWWVATVPGIMIVLLVIAVNLLGDLLRDSLDPNIDHGGGNV